MNSIEFTIDGQVVGARPGESILDACLRSRVDLPHSCGGSGSCGTCRVVVVAAPTPLGARNDIESELAGDRGLSPGERLSCQTEPVPGLQLRTPK